MKPSWSIRLVRALFFALSVFAGIAISLGMGEPAWIGALLGAGYMGLLLGLDVVFARFSLRDLPRWWEGSFVKRPHLLASFQAMRGPAQAISA